MQMRRAKVLTYLQTAKLFFNYFFSTRLPVPFPKELLPFFR